MALEKSSPLKLESCRRRFRSLVSMWLSLFCRSLRVVAPWPCDRNDCDESFEYLS